MPDVLITGATGTTGSRVAKLLRAQSIPVRLATRTPGAERAQIRFDWDTGIFDAALAGVSAVYLVAPTGVADPVPLVTPFVEQARRYGVRRIVLLGSSAIAASDSGLGGLYHLIRSLPEWTVLRPSWFMQNFLGDSPVAQGVRDGEIVTATGAGRIGFVDAGDIAAVAARALTDPEPHPGELILTGPQALSYAEAAEIITDRIGRPVRHRSASVAEYAARLADSGIPPAYAAMLAGLDDDIRRGAEDRITDTVPRVTGRPARGFHEFVTKEMTR
ncbi:NmrA family NAD(P)-binding protein [Nocardia terpenica]|uniref:NAD(P)-dependent oxidoreductase n=1 Tax=Nocardia terpenica TaxID=455432 RepID=A0A164L8Y9_9NOCA|nr:NmrA family NAD(P)-binding protein [Nocardia terpenica]KZM72145.1 NAD(P)-dependent oxidoreductase [Nocardia terpenica]NQE86721.1 NAD(P)H-binding protein [Nocardia terpenica]